MELSVLGSSKRGKKSYIKHSQDLETKASKKKLIALGARPLRKGYI